MRSAAAAFLCWSVVCLQSAQAALCIADVNVIEVVSGRTIEGAAVVVSGDRIRSVSSPPAVERDCEVTVDGAGKFLIPGLWDMHVHGSRRANHWPLYIANGVTGVREMFGSNEASASAAVAPHRYSAGPIVDGPPGVWAGSQLAANAEDARRIVAEQHDAGADFIKVYSLLGADAYAAIFDEAAKRGLPVAGHVPESSSAREAAAYGQRSIEHLEDIAVSCASSEAELRARPAASFVDVVVRQRDAYRTFEAAKCRQLAGVFRENDTWMVPTLSVMYGSSAEVDLATVEERATYFDEDTLRWIVPPEKPPAEALELFQQTFEDSVELTGFLYRERVPILAGTDVMNPHTFPGFSIHDELELLVRAGLTPLDALRSATLNPAVFLGRDGELGSIEAGKLADLVLLDADPLADIGNTTRIRAVVRGGEYFSRERLDELLLSAQRAATARTEQ